MKPWIRRLAVIALLASQSGAAEPADPLSRCIETFSAISKQMRVERAVCSAILAEGVSQGRWTDEEKAVAEDWLSFVFDDSGEETALTTDPMNQPEREWRRFASRVLKGMPELATTWPVLSWFHDRFFALHNLRLQTLRESHALVMRDAEAAWLSARSPADLEKAVGELARLKSAIGFRWGELTSSQFGDRLSDRGSHVSAVFQSGEMWEFHDCWVVLASAEPLLLPDPETDPAAFAIVRRDWLASRHRSQEFLKRPAIHQRFMELDGRFRSAFMASQRKLDAAILRDAPAEEFEAELKRLSRFVPPPRAKTPAPGTPRVNPGGPFSDTPPDYQSELSRLAYAFPTQLPPDIELRWASDYAGWLEWRRAIEAGDEPQARKAQAALLQKMRDFRPAVAAHLTARFAQLPAPIAAKKTAVPAAAFAVPDAPTAAALATALRAAAVTPEAAIRDTEVASLLRAWNAFEQGGNAAPADANRFAGFWSGIASRPDGSALLGLRDRAVREALVQIVPEAAGADGEPLYAQFRRALQRAIAGDAVDKLARLLALDRLSVTLLDRERASWEQTLEIVKRAKLRTPDGDPAADRQTWIEILRTTEP